MKVFYFFTNKKFKIEHKDIKREYNDPKKSELKNMYNDIVECIRFFENEKNEELLEGGNFRQESSSFEFEINILYLRPLLSQILILISDNSSHVNLYFYSSILNFMSYSLKLKGILETSFCKIMLNIIYSCCFYIEIKDAVALLDSVIDIGRDILGGLNNTRLHLKNSQIF
ncbi:hypothetical protein CWI39_0335p0010 [Hamiltosporidium magnivora]|uniref:Uncharacterized protein n=1 Tax=Hamiltosporidium magnivora TaxID=148818 RepID=A0A4Q9LJ67_9MICR|nr:hypothetical protein CWI39_0335p0010 [Hamiltosporidium magnivora]